MHRQLCTDADDLLCCSATVWNCGERGEPGKALGSFECHKNRVKQTDIHCKHESELDGNGSGRESNPGP